MRTASPPTVDGSTWLKNVATKLICNDDRKSRFAAHAQAIWRQRSASKAVWRVKRTTARIIHSGSNVCSRPATAATLTQRSERKSNTTEIAALASNVSVRRMIASFPGQVKWLCWGRGLRTVRPVAQVHWQDCKRVPVLREFRA